MRTLSFHTRVARAPYTESGQTVIRDESLPGFMVVIGQRTKTYTIQIDLQTLGGRRTHKEKIARFEDVDYKTARNMAMEQIALLRTGKRKPGQPDPGPTLQEALEHYVTGHLTKRGRAAGTIAQYRDVIGRTLKPWADTPLRDLSEKPGDVAHRHDQITSQNGPWHADHTMRSLRAVYNFARKSHRELPVDHPCIAVVYNDPDGPGDGMDAKQLAEWFKEWAAVENPIRREMHLMCLLSGSRRTPLTVARWEHVDLKARGWLQPAPKSGKPFTIPLSGPMVASLKRVKEHSKVPFDNSPWVYPSATSESGHVEEIKGDLGAAGHRLRRTFITQSKIAGVSTFLAKVLVDHAAGGAVHETYVSVPALHDALLQAQEAISKQIIKCAGKEARALLK
jgi:integrase